ncbi:hypothetical protein D3C87_1747910 [compost metagenome]
MLRQRLIGAGDALAQCALMLREVACGYAGRRQALPQLLESLRLVAMLGLELLGRTYCRVECSCHCAGGRVYRAHLLCERGHLLLGGDHLAACRLQTSGEVAERADIALGCIEGLELTA